MGKWISERVRPCNKPGAYACLCAGSLLGCEMFWEYVKDNVEAVKVDFGGCFTKKMEATLKCFGTREKHDEVERFFEENVLVGAERTIAQMLEHIRIKAGVLERDGEAIENYFKNCL